MAPSPTTVSAPPRNSTDTLAQMCRRFSTKISESYLSSVSSPTWVVKKTIAIQVHSWSFSTLRKKGQNSCTGERQALASPRSSFPNRLAPTSALYLMRIQSPNSLIFRRVLSVLFMCLVVLVCYTCRRERSSETPPFFDSWIPRTFTLILEKNMLLRQHILKLQIPLSLWAAKIHQNQIWPKA